MYIDNYRYIGSSRYCYDDNDNFFITYYFLSTSNNRGRGRGSSSSSSSSSSSTSSYLALYFRGICRPYIHTYHTYIQYTIYNIQSKNQMSFEYFT